MAGYGTANRRPCRDSDAAIVWNRSRPGISLDSFEVGDEVYDSFAAAGFEMAAISRHDKKWHIDLPVCNQIQLQEAGVRAIYLSGICTYQHADRYFSARRLGIQSGRIFTAIMLK